MIDMEPKAAGSTPQPYVHDAEPVFHGVPGRGLIIEKRQVITPEMLQHAHDARIASAVQAGELHEVASVPAAVVEHWARQGFDILKDKNIKAHDIVKRLKEEGLDKFVCTEKKV